MKFLFNALLPVLFVAMSGCIYHNEEDVYPVRYSSECDTGLVSFQQDLLPLFNGRCGASNSCHQSGSNTSGIPLDNYTDVLTYAQSGQLLGSILHDPNYVAMPLGSSMLDSCSIKKIESWMNNQMPNN